MGNDNCKVFRESIHNNIFSVLCIMIAEQMKSLTQQNHRLLMPLKIIHK